VIDSLFTSDDERAAAKLKLLELDLKPAMAQLEVNKAEAANPNWFVAGWRPAIGWTCGFIFLYTFVLRDLLSFAVAVAGVDMPPIPQLDLGEVYPVLLGLLGLGGMRTFEKFKNAEAKR
jgi:hypothetical protein